MCVAALALGGSVHNEMHYNLPRSANLLNDHICRSHHHKGYVAPLQESRYPPESEGRTLDLAAFETVTPPTPQTTSHIVQVERKSGAEMFPCFKNHFDSADREIVRG